jgi:diguanylate cyclase (GGDEF)-like protein
MKYSSLLLLFVTSVTTQAETAKEIDAFIKDTRVKTYDCPSSDAIPTLEEYLKSPELTKSQEFELKVEKSHWMICMGKYVEAKTLLNELIGDKQISHSSIAYASATYQIGFILDVQEDDERCNYYQKAEQLSKDKFDDIYLSAQLGQITVCNGGEGNDGIKLGRLYALLELYLGKGDKQAIAHIHNNIGLLYGALGQHVLAAEQYQKSYEMGLGVYEGSNLLATLISAITSHMASGDFEAAKQAIDVFRQTNLDVNTPLTNNWLHFAEAGYYYRTKNFSELKDSLTRWEVYLEQSSSQTFKGFYRWYTAALCLDKGDKPCLLKFLEAEELSSDGYKNLLNKNKDYLKMQVEVYLFLGDVAKAQEKFAQFADLMMYKAMSQQSSGKILGVANLHAQIMALESNLAEANSQKKLTILLIIIAAILALIAVWCFLRKQHLSKLSSDPLTGLHTTKNAFSLIKRVKKAAPGKANAIALFDLVNFKQVTVEFGPLVADLALQKVAKTLKQVTRDQDILGRLASDQFIVCLTNIEEITAKMFFERIGAALQDTILVSESGKDINLTSSMSIYVSTEPFDDLDDIMTDMRRALLKT